MTAPEKDEPLPVTPPGITSSQPWVDEWLRVAERYMRQMHLRLIADLEAGKWR